MTYEETLKFLFERLPMYQRDGKSAYKKDLTNTLQLLEALGNPHLKFRSVHIAGTNGKGTSAHGIAAILQTAGYKTGLYTSPHLKHFTERIKIDGSEIGAEEIVRFVEQIRPEIERIQPSFFEITVAMAFDHFANAEVDIAVIETGLGGRLDSTNVITPEACLITNIGYDHTDMLGETLAQIAGEKAGIIKPAVPVIIGAYHAETFPVFEEKALKQGAKLLLNEQSPAEDLKKYPFYKAANYGAVRLLCQTLKEGGWEKITESSIEEGYDNLEVLTGLKGRFQQIQERPQVIADVSHNAEGLQGLFQNIDRLLEKQQGKLHLIFGTVKGKELGSVFKLFPKGVNVFWTQSSVPRSLPVNELAIQGVMHGIEGECFKNVNEALQQAKGKASSSDLILVTGSTFVVAELDDL